MTDQLAPGGALRLTFDYDGDDVWIADSHRVEMLVPPSDPLTGHEGQAGFWIELRDADGRPVFRRILHDPMPGYVEVHSPLSRPAQAPVTERSGSFDADLPAPPFGATAVLFASPAPDPVRIGDYGEERARDAVPRAATEPAVEIARFPLDGAAL